LKRRGSDLTPSHSLDQKSFSQANNLASQSFVEQQEKDKIAKSKPADAPVPWMRMWADLKGYQLIFLLAGTAAAGMGALNPIIGFQLSVNIGVLSDLKDSKSGADSDLNMVFVEFIIMAVAGFLAGWISMWLFALSGQNLAYRIRIRLFTKVMGNNIAFFDRPEHSPGNLCANLEEDASALQNAMTGLVGTYFMTFGNLLVALG
jgi:ABC-type multidrug transport system fused ATPase/permease subunit